MTGRLVSGTAGPTWDAPGSYRQYRTPNSLAINLGVDVAVGAPSDAADGARGLLETTPQASPAQAKVHRIDNEDRMLDNWTCLLPGCADAVEP